MFFRKIGVFTQKLPFAKDFEITLLLCEPLPFHPQGSDHVLSKDWHTPDEQTHIPEVTTLWIRIILHSLFPSVCFSWLVYFSMNEKIFTSFYISRNYVVWSTAFPVWDHALLSGGSFQPVCFQSISFELLLFLKISYFFPHSPFNKEPGSKDYRIIPLSWTIPFLLFYPRNHVYWFHDYASLVLYLCQKFDII